MRCRLCQHETELRRSHIISDFFLDHSGLMYPTGDSGKLQPFTQPIHIQPGTKFQRMQHGYWEKRNGMVEYLLCAECEQKLSVWEGYAKRFFYGHTNPIRLQLSVGEDSFKADYGKMKLFQLSLLWRAGEAKGEFFSTVRLNGNDRERLRLMLLNDDPGEEEEYFCTMNRLVVSRSVQRLQVAHGIATETGLFAPVNRNHGTWDSYLFVMGGLIWTFCVCKSGVPEILRNSYIKTDGRFFLLPLDGDAFLINFAQKVIQAGNLTKADAEESMQAKRGK